MPRLSKIGAAALAAFGWTSGSSVSASYLVVAGGGAGGSSTVGSGGAGAGGAGGLQTGTTSLNPTLSYTVVVGAGAATLATGVSGLSSGSNSSFGSLTASVGGGGGAGGPYNGTGASGGSGGGGSGNYQTVGGSGTSGQGNAGGSGVGSNGGGGGGGANAIGSNGSGTNPASGGAGGAGTASSISGTSVTYAGGGGGGNFNGGSAGAGGAGGGGAGGNPATSGTPNLGGGGGGATGNVAISGGNGGSGVVIISYAGPQQFGGGIVTSVGGYTIHTFNTSGTLSTLSSLTASYLIVAGGGGGGCGNGGGGGAGGLLSGSSLTIDTNSVYAVAVGAGGPAAAAQATVTATSGGNSSFSMVSTTAVGGGGGGTGYGAGSYNNALSGGSGGGGGQNGGTGAAGTAGQGNAGTNGGNSGSPFWGGGGGGSGSAASAGSAGIGGNGGTATISSISGTSTYYAGGGGGGSGTSSGSGTSGGLGGGTSTVANKGGATDGSNSNTAASNATSNTGGGGGGGGYTGGTNAGAGGNGGSGVVIISYPGSTQQMQGGNVTIVGGNVIHTFTASGLLTPITNLNNSLRFRGSNSAKLSRTVTTASSSTKGTFSCWVKRGKDYDANNNGCLVSAADSYYYGQFYQQTLYFGNTTNWMNTAAVYRDPAAWYHVVFVFDTTLATSTDRLQIWVNGVRQTAGGVTSYPSQNASFPFLNSAQTWYMGGRASDGYLDGYLTEINFIDGQALTPYSFGGFNSYGTWSPVRYAGSYGTNGFYLPFTNGTSTTTLGYDFSNNGNNWTTNNISLTAGSTYDWMTDVPTLTSATVANYTVMNPLNTYSSITVNNANLQLTLTEAAYRKSVATMAFGASGLYYLEGTVTGGNQYVSYGIVTPEAPLSDAVGQTATGYGAITGSTQWDRKNNGSTSSNFWTISVSSPTLQIAVDMSSGKLWLGYNNTWLDSSGGTTGNPSAGTNPTFTIDTTRMYLPSFGGYKSDSIVINTNFGQRPFTYTPPSGFVALNSYNL